MTPRARKSAPVLTGSFSFSYEEFADWYRSLTRSLLEPARITFIRILEEMLDQELSDVDRLRIRLSHSRIKAESRLWNKILSEKYAGRVKVIDDIPEVIDDMVGLRVTCNNLVDVEVFRDIVIGLQPFDPAEFSAGLCIDPNSERRHVKESGYRAYHINLHTQIAARSGWKPARGELQVRTLLQDSWGELTHEDTYKPGSHMPQLINQFAKRMADLLATVDDLAQDLRNELDDLAQTDAVHDEENGYGSDPDGSGGEQPSTDIRDALLAEARQVTSSLTKPASLAQVAWRVQANFGREVTENWGGFGSFKALLRAAVPDIQIIDIPPGTVVPTAVARSVAAAESAGLVDGNLDATGVPLIVSRLRQHDAGVPAVPAGKLGSLLVAISTSLSEAAWNELDLDPKSVSIREINQLTKLARCSQGEPPASRSHVDYLMKCLYFSQSLRPGLDKEEIAVIVEEYLFRRASKRGLVIDQDIERGELSRWFGAALSSA